MLYMPLRIATTGIMHGPDLAASMELLGKEKVLKKIRIGNYSYPFLCFFYIEFDLCCFFLK